MIFYFPVVKFTISVQGICAGYLEFMFKKQGPGLRQNIINPARLFRYYFLIHVSNTIYLYQNAIATHLIDAAASVGTYWRRIREKSAVTFIQ